MLTLADILYQLPSAKIGAAKTAIALATTNRIIFLIIIKLHDSFVLHIKSTRFVSISREIMGKIISQVDPPFYDQTGDFSFREYELKHNPQYSLCNLFLFLCLPMIAQF